MIKELKEIAGEIIYSLCDGLEEGIENYQLIFKYCTQIMLDRLQLNPMIRPMINMVYGEDYWKMMKNCYD